MFFLPVWTIVNHLFFDRCRLVKAVSIFELWRNIFVLSLSFWFIDDHRWAKPQVAQVCPESLRKHVIDARRQSRKALREPNGRKSAWKIYKVQRYNHRSEMDTFYSMRVQIPKSKIEPFVPTKISLIRSLLNVCNLFFIIYYLVIYYLLFIIYLLLFFSSLREIPHYKRCRTRVSPPARIGDKSGTNNENCSN